VVSAAKYGVSLCVKAHVDFAVYNTSTTLRALREINDPHFGIDMDTSQIFRACEKPETVLSEFISRVKHVHIRDCPDNGPTPGTPQQQTCGRGKIDLFGFLKNLVEADYQGPVCFEACGVALNFIDATIIAAESFGYMNACLKKLGAR